MLAQRKINQVQHQLKRYHVLIFTSPKTDDAIALAHPKNVGQTIRIHLVASHHRWIALVNQQLIHAQCFIKGNYSFNFNFRQNNAIDNGAKKSLISDLRTNFNIQTTSTGLLVAKVDHNIVTAFLNLMNAILYLSNNGDRYLVQTGSTVRADQQLQSLIQIIKKANQTYHKAKNHGRSHQHHKDNRPKAHGKVVAGFSSTAGTPREIRYARERRVRRKKKIFLIKHPGIVRRHKQEKSFRLAHQKFSLQNKKVVLAGRLSRPRTSYRRMIRRLGGIVQQRVNGQTNYLICNQPNHSLNYQVAKRNHVKIIRESQIKNH